jgi:hypothetical protein
MNTETIEEANWKVLGTKNDTFYNGAKWVQERMYSEEEVAKLIDRAFKMYACDFRKEAKQFFEENKK